MTVVIACEITIDRCRVCGAPFVYVRSSKHRLTCGARCRAKRAYAINYRSGKANAERCKVKGIR